MDREWTSALGRFSQRARGGDVVLLPQNTHRLEMLILGIALALAAATTASAAPTAIFAATTSIVTDALQAEGFTSPEWIAALQRAREIVGNMTLDEKVNFTDHPKDTQGCAGLTFPIARFNVSSICYGDGPSVGLSSLAFCSPACKLLCFLCPSVCKGSAG